MRNFEIKDEINEIKKWEEKIKQKDVKHKKINIHIIFINMKQ